MQKEKALISQEDQTKILAAIQSAEKNTSGEIRVHIEAHCPYDLMDRAADVFSFLEMHKTELRNGVLFYIALNDRVFAILGDAGINNKVSPYFWDDTKLKMQTLFKKGSFVDGLCLGIEEAGIQLSNHFPYSNSDVNELSDEISFS